jgi:MFS family permease
VLIESVGRLTGVPWARQGPAFLVGLGHGTTHWIAAFFYLLLPFIARDIGLSYTDTGFLVSVFHLSALAANFGSGFAVDITGRRIVYQVISLLIGGGALLGFGLTHQFLVLTGLVVLLGASNNLWHPPAIAYLSEHYPQNRGYALSVHALCANLGDTLAPLAAGALLLVLTWQGTALTGALPVFAIAVILILFLRQSVDKTGQPRDKHSGIRDYLSQVGRIARDRTVLALCVMSGMRNIAQNGLYVFLPLYLVNELDSGPLWLGITMTALQAGGLLASPVAGAWSDRAGRRPVVLAGLSVTTIVIAAITLTQNDLFLVATVSLLGFALFAVRPVIHSWMMDLSPPNIAGSATSILFGTQALLTTIMMPLGGLVADRYGLPVVFYCLAGTILLANLIVYWLPSEKGRPES